MTATAIWKLFSDRTRDPKIVSFAQRLITLTDWSLTFWGVVLTILGGYAAAASRMWFVVGIISTVPLVAAVWMMIAKPS